MDELLKFLKDKGLSEQDLDIFNVLLIQYMESVLEGSLNNDLSLGSID